LWPAAVPVFLTTISGRRCGHVQGRACLPLTLHHA
jgi:hypothetical protein